MRTRWGPNRVFRYRSVSNYVANLVQQYDYSITQLQLPAFPNADFRAFTEMWGEMRVRSVRIKFTPVFRRPVAIPQQEAPLRDIIPHNYSKIQWIDLSKNPWIARPDNAEQFRAAGTVHSHSIWSTWSINLKYPRFPVKWESPVSGAADISTHSAQWLTTHGIAGTESETVYELAYLLVPGGQYMNFQQYWEREVSIVYEFRKFQFPTF